MAKEGLDCALSMEEARVFGQVLIPKLKSRSGSDMVLEGVECAVVEKLMKWPTAKVFAVLDVARLVICMASGGAYFFGRKNGDILRDVLEHMCSTEASAAVHIMGCRFLCNLFGNRVVGSAVRKDMEHILEVAGAAAKCDNRRARETYASLVINYAVMLFEDKAGLDERGVVIRTAVRLISDGGEKDEEVLYRLLTAVGTVMCGDDEAAKRGVELGVAQAAADVASVSARLQQVALEIATLIAI